MAKKQAVKSLREKKAEECDPESFLPGKAQQAMLFITKHG